MAGEKRKSEELSSPSEPEPRVLKRPRYEIQKYFKPGTNEVSMLRKDNETGERTWITPPQNVSTSTRQRRPISLLVYALVNRARKSGRTPPVGLRSLGRRKSSPFPVQTNNGALSREAPPHRPASYNGNSNLQPQTAQPAPYNGNGSLQQQVAQPVSYNGNSEHQQQIVQPAPWAPATNSHGGYEYAYPSPPPNTPLSPPRSARTQSEDAIYHSTGVNHGNSSQVGSSPTAASVGALPCDAQLLEQLNQPLGPQGFPYNFHALDCGDLFEGKQSQPVQGSQRTPVQVNYFKFLPPSQPQTSRVTSNEIPPASQHQEPKSARSPEGSHSRGSQENHERVGKSSRPVVGREGTNSTDPHEQTNVDPASASRDNMHPSTNAPADHKGASSRLNHAGIKSLFESKVDLHKDVHPLGNYFGQDFWVTNGDMSTIRGVFQKVMEEAYPDAMTLLGTYRTMTESNINTFRDKALSMLGFTKQNRDSFIAHVTQTGSDADALWNHMPYQIHDWIEGALLIHLKAVYGDPANWPEEVTAQEAKMAHDDAIKVMAFQLHTRHISISRDLEERGTPSAVWSWASQPNPTIPQPAPPQNTTSLKRRREDDEGSSEPQSAPKEGRSKKRVCLKRPSPLKAVMAPGDFCTTRQQEAVSYQQGALPKQPGGKPTQRFEPSAKLGEASVIEKIRKKMQEKTRKKAEPKQMWEPSSTDYPELPGLGATLPASDAPTGKAPWVHPSRRWTI